MNDFNTNLKLKTKEVEDIIYNYFPKEEGKQKIIIEAMNYSLKAGGPVARPDSNMIILTPICPHTLANRSLILSRHDNIEVKIGKSRIANEENRRISFDGDGVFKIISGDIISISESEKTTKIAKLDEGSFLQAVKDKLN